MAAISFERKLCLVNLKDGENLSFRETSARTSIPKSTIHDNIANYRQEVEAFRTAIKTDPVERLVRTSLALGMNGKCSSRDSSSVMTEIWGVSISHQTILKIMELAAQVAEDLNKELDLSDEKVALFDEIFQKQNPLLVFASANSAVVNVQASQDRSGDSWKEFLKSLKKLGLDPKSIVTDGGSGMLKGIKEVFEASTMVRDLFHVLKKISKARRVMENYCYSLLAKAYDTKVAIETAREAMTRFDEAALLFDSYEEKVIKFRISCYLDSSESSGGYVDAQALAAITSNLETVLSEFMDKFSSHRAVKEARDYLKNGAKEIIAYKVKIESLIEQSFGNQYKAMVLEHLCPLIEYIHQYFRSRDSISRKTFWGKKIAELRTRFRSYQVIDQNEVDRAIDTIWAIGQQVCKSNSLVESVNSVIRAFLNTYKSIPSWFCPLFTFYWNNREFERGKRAKQSPMEIHSGEKSRNWIDRIVENFPFEKLRSSLPAIPGYYNAEWDEISKTKSSEYLLPTG
jgi:predicted DNA-binding protein YlxM (UPF0122 family)